MMPDNNDNAGLPGPSFLVTVRDDNGNDLLLNPHSPEPMEGDVLPPGMEFVDFPDALLPDTPFPSTMNDDTPQKLTMMPLGGERFPPDLLLDSIDTPQLHVPDATSLSRPPWPGGLQEFIFHPPPPIQLQGTPYFSGGQAIVADRAESLTPTSAGFGELDGLGLPIQEPGSVIFGASQHPFTEPTPFLNHFGLQPQALGHKRVMDENRVVSGFKTPFDDAQSPKRPIKRHCSIQPKPCPMPPSQAGNASETTPGCDLNLGGKQGGIPINMLATFKVEGPGIASPSGKRTRSKKVCLKCQSLRKKVSFGLDFLPVGWSFPANSGSAVRWRIPLSALPRLRPRT